MKSVKDLDKEWIALMNVAKEQGLTIEEVRKFLQGSSILSHKEELKATSM
ncbi:hypothetical protein A374_10303 [Fictibacillus macauensis ZFHKF-1]|uniref:Sin domain-containing protein n=1 Tax=Fictibacillus macauensis ZFHKF-1 TaxID=1196324 RepID=I8UFE9_9BACL|nr:anti-repressor SinI family protein [Fictibacillus macauensis]EIT85620.1 hypothetical protein A374_10303 [Fictibacillus macauensis ZFHKF-1]